MKVAKCHLEGILVIHPLQHVDERGFFLETFEDARYREIGVVDRFVQENHSRSVRNVLRGLHFTSKKPQAQLVTVMYGRVFDVVVDIRKQSLSYGQWFGVELGEGCPRQVYMPSGFAHGFCVLSDWADLHYKVSHRYDPHDEGGLHWNDQDVGIEWPIVDPIISPRDRLHQKLSMI